MDQTRRRRRGTGVRLSDGADRFSIRPPEGVGGVWRVNASSVHTSRPTAVGQRRYVTLSLLHLYYHLYSDFSSAK